MADALVDSGSGEESLISRIQRARMGFIPRYGIDPSVILMTPGAIARMFDEIWERGLFDRGDAIALRHSVMGMALVESDEPEHYLPERDFLVGFLDKTEV